MAADPAADDLAIARLLDMFGLPPHSAGRDFKPHEDVENDFDRLTLRTAALGLSLVGVIMSLRSAGPLASRSSPLLTRMGSGWLLLEGSGGRRLRVSILGERPAVTRSMPISSVAKLLGVDHDAPVNWIAVQPCAPLQNAVSGATKPLEPAERLWKLLRLDRSEIGLSVLFALGVGLLSLATPVAVQALVNTVALGGLFQPLLVLSFLLFAFLVFGGALRVLQTYVVEIIQRRVFVRVLMDLAYRLPRLRSEVLDQRHGTELVNRFFDVLTVQKVSAILLLDGVAVVLQTFIGLLVLAFYHPILLAFDLVLVSAILLVVIVLGRGAEKTAIYESKHKYLAAGWLEEIARSPLTFKLHGGTALAAVRANARALDYLEARSAHFQIVLRQTIGTLAVQAVAGTALLAVGGNLVISGQLTLGQLVAAELIVSTVLASFTKFGKHLESFYDLLAAVDKLGQVLDAPLEQTEGRVVPDTATPATLRVKQLSFKYDNGAEVVRDLSFAVAAGERLGIVGGPGSGKSTLSDLLFGLRDYSEGRIELNGIDVRDLRRENLRRYIHVVKGIEILEGSIAENVRMGRDDIRVLDVQTALTKAGLWDELAVLPDGVNTVLGHAGAPLSVSQAERLMLARAIAGQPRLLVIDGILDDLDPEVRNRICDYLFADDAPWTLIISSVHADGYMLRCNRFVHLNGSKQIAAATS